MPIHHDHEPAEVGIRSAVCRSRIADRVTCVVDVRHWRPAGLVRPHPVPALAIPVEVIARSDHQGNELTLRGTQILRVWRRDQSRRRGPPD